MGTRADFYIGRGAEAEWLGSIAFDGYPDGRPRSLLRCATEQEFRDMVAKLSKELDHFTIPEQGWPWPWKDSQATDYAYAFDEQKVFVSCFGRGWATGSAVIQANGSDDADPWEGNEKTAFPDMTSRQRVTLGHRAGALFIGLNKEK